MFFKLFLVFTIIPITEIYILIKIGSIFGAISSILLVIFTGFLGALLAKIQGINTLFSIQESIREGKIPSEELFDAVLIFIAGILLITPGFLTDIVGFILLTKVSRKLIKFWLLKKIKLKFMSNRPEDVIIEQ